MYVFLFVIIGTRKSDLTNNLTLFQRVDNGTHWKIFVRYSIKVGWHFSSFNTTTFLHDLYPMLKFTNFNLITQIPFSIVGVITLNFVVWMVEIFNSIILLRPLNFSVKCSHRYSARKLKTSIKCTTNLEGICCSKLKLYMIFCKICMLGFSLPRVKAYRHIWTARTRVVNCLNPLWEIISDQWWAHGNVTFGYSTHGTWSLCDSTNIDRKTSYTVN